jgi:predicted enzyme related to lactoylglutathione lyase
MGNPKGDFIWYELLTRDADAAQRFYGEVVGWTAINSGQPGMDYRIFDAGDGMAGGLMQINDQMPGAKPVWLGYVAVPDVDAAVAEWTVAGGRVQMPAMDIPECRADGDAGRSRRRAAVRDARHGRCEERRFPRRRRAPCALERDRGQG